MRYEANRSYDRGMEFEKLVAILLNLLRVRHPEKVRITRHPRVKLYNGTVAIPDFELVCDLPHQIDHRLIECQDRHRSSQDIAHKIRDIKSLSRKNRVVLVYREPEYLSQPVRRALDADGVVCYSLYELATFLERMGQTLDALVKRAPSADLAGEMAKTIKREVGESGVAKFKASQLSSPKSDEAMLATPPNQNPWRW